MNSSAGALGPSAEVSPAATTCLRRVRGGLPAALHGARTPPHERSPGDDVGSRNGMLV
jgi:hypothetical protein